MRPSLAIPAQETGVIRVFALDAKAPALAAILPPHPLDAGHLAPLLGLPTIRDEDAERVTLKDLGNLSLSEFLRVGHDIREDDLAPLTEALDALAGHVLLIHSTAFGGEAAHILPAPGIRFVGAFRRTEAPAAPLTLPEAERPEILAPPPMTVSRRRGSGLVLALVILVSLAAVLILYGRS